MGLNIFDLLCDMQCIHCNKLALHSFVRPELSCIYFIYNFIGQTYIKIPNRKSVDNQRIYELVQPLLYQNGERRETSLQKV